MKYNLTANPILLPHQIQILRLFFASPFANTFFLTGGTALSAFYLAHRDSKDLDLFSMDDFDPQQLLAVMNDLAKQTNSQVTTKVSATTYYEIYLENQSDKWIQRLDFVHEQPRHFGDIATIEKVRVDSLENIGSNKITAIFGRLEPKDYIDLYCIIKFTDLKFDKLFDLAKQKDLGLSEFMFANIIAEIEKIQNWPPLKTNVNIQEVVSFYTDLSTALLSKIKPSEL